MKVAVRGPDDCWLWTAGTNRHGYGQFRRGMENSNNAQIFAWELAHGKPVPKGLCVCHACDVRLCQNPRHLFLGTKADNVRDMLDKGRQAKGEKNSNAKLTETQVKEIRDKFANGVTKRQLAAEYGLYYKSIQRITSRRAWTHIS